MTVVAGSGTKFEQAIGLVLDENHGLLTALEPEEWNRAGSMISSARSVFVIGGGRSGLAAQMVAMRLMHLGLAVHIAGAVTAPAVGAGDLVIAVSGSGTTSAVVAAADTALKVGARVLAVTTKAQSPLSQYADQVLVLPAAEKQNHDNGITRQYAGSLFEQSVLLAFDALFHSLWSAQDQTAELLWTRHANIG